MRRQFRQRHTDSYVEVAINNVADSIERLDFDKEIHDFKQRLTATERVITDMYLIKGIKSGNELARHFGIGKSTLYNEYGKLLTKLKDYETLKRGIRRGKH